MKDVHWKLLSSTPAFYICVLQKILELVTLQYQTTISPSTAPQLTEHHTEFAGPGPRGTSGARGPPKEKAPKKQAPKDQEEEEEEENSQDSEFNPDELLDTANILDKLHKNR